MTTGDWVFIIRAGRVEKRMIHGSQATCWAFSFRLEGGIYRKKMRFFLRNVTLNGRWLGCHDALYPVIQQTAKQALKVLHKGCVLSR